LSAAAAGETVARPVLLAEFAFASGTTRVWSGIGTLSWNGADYTGLGTFGEVSAIEETMELRATGAAFRLSGIPADLVSTAMGEPIQGRAARLRLGFLDESLALIEDPVLLFDGRMDTLEITDGGEHAAITLFAENRLRDLERPRTRRYTDQDQQAEYPGDRGFEFVPALQEVTINWGSAVE
jgi:hypothetical protein